MKFSCESDVLTRVVEVIEKAVPKKTTERVLLNIHMLVRDDTCTITGTDNRTRLSTQFTVDSDENFEVCVDASSLMKALKKIKSNETISIEVDCGNSMVEIQTKKFTQTFKHILDVRNFPYTDYDIGIEKHIIGRRQMEKIIQATKEFHGAGNKRGYDKIYYGKYESQFYENDVADEDKTYFTSWAGTDTVRLFYKFDEKPFPLKDEMMISSQTIGILGKVLATKACKKSLGVFLQQGREVVESYSYAKDDESIDTCLFVIPSEYGIFKLHSKLCEKGFPDFKRIIPKDNTVASIVNSERLIESVNICSDISSQDSKGKIVITLKDDLFTIKAETNMDKIESSFDCKIRDDRSNESVERDPAFTLAYNGKFLGDMMSIFKDSPCDKDGNNVTMEYTSSIHPSIFRAIDDTDNVSWLLMPIHT